MSFTENKEYVSIHGLGAVMSNIGNKIISNQDILKCLQYNSPNALELMDVSQQQIVNLVGKGVNSADDRRIFGTPFNDQIVDDIRSELRFFVDNIRCRNIYIANMPIVFQTVTHNTLWELDNNKYRAFVIIHELLKLFNGMDIGGIGLMQFEGNIQLYTYNRNYSGYMMSLTTKAG